MERTGSNEAFEIPGQRVPNNERSHLIETTLTHEFSFAPYGDLGMTLLRRYLKRINIKRKRGALPPVGAVKSIDIVNLAQRKREHYRDLLQHSVEGRESLGSKLRYWETMEKCSLRLYRLTHPQT